MAVILSMGRWVNFVTAGWFTSITADLFDHIGRRAILQSPSTDDPIWKYLTLCRTSSAMTRRGPLREIQLLDLFHVCCVPDHLRSWPKMFQHWGRVYQRNISLTALPLAPVIHSCTETKHTAKCHGCDWCIDTSSTLKFPYALHILFVTGLCLN